MEKRDLCLKLFLPQDPKQSDALLRFLPQDRGEKVKALPFMALQEISLKSPLDPIHWSWFLPKLESYAAKDQKLFVQALGQTTQKHLVKSLKIKKLSAKTSPLLNAFLRETIWQELQEGQERLNIECLPHTQLNALLGLDKTRLIHLIDLLSLYDLSLEIRQIVETKILKKIYSFLSEDERKSLKAMTGYREPYPLQRLDLQHWDGKEKSLRLLLHKRGLLRLSIALSGQNPDLVWHLAHRLDSGRGNALMKVWKKEPIPKVSAWMAGQIEELFATQEKT